jgi:acetylornithine deacetylase/succinyl-diaminopimelate desuccinylase-like protein
MYLNRPPGLFLSKWKWKGSDQTSKPIFLTAYKDVVPVFESTLGQWEQPPFSGLYDGTKSDYVRGELTAGYRV